MPACTSGAAACSAPTMTRNGATAATKNSAGLELRNLTRWNNTITTITGSSANAVRRMVAFSPAADATSTIRCHVG